MPIHNGGLAANAPSILRCRATQAYSSVLEKMYIPHANRNQWRDVGTVDKTFTGHTGSICTNNSNLVG